MKITATIIAFNEEKKIAEAVESVGWADEILVVDSESTDRTREIAESLGARVFVNPWPGFAAQKRLAVKFAENDWILSIDADERVSPRLKDEILELRKRQNTADGYRIPRLSIYMGRPIRHSGWYPDWQLRLFNRRKGSWKDVAVHESVQMEPDAKVERLTGDLLHYSVDGPLHHHRMIGERYAPLAAEQMFKDGRRTSPLMAAFSGWASFNRAYFLKAGFLDGFPGFCIACFAGYHTFLKHLLLLELQKAASKAE